MITQSTSPGTVLTGAAVLTMDAGDRLLEVADIRIVGRRIDAIGAPGTLARGGDAIIDCTDTLVMPGLVDTHTHACAGLLRGLTEDLPREHWNGNYGVAGQERFQTEDYLLSARASCAEFLLNGVTCIADRWGGIQAIPDVLDAAGIRAVFGCTLTDNNGPANWAMVDALIERWGADPAHRITAAIAPHAPDTCSDVLLRACAHRAERLGNKVYLHLAQSTFEVAKLRARGYSGAVACLANNGLAGPQTVAAHCIYLTPEEIESWGTHRTSIAHCPGSNLKIEARTVPVHKLLDRACIGIGTDWAATDNGMDMLAEARLAAMIGKHLADDPAALPIRTVLRMATIEGARALGLDGVIGSVEVGKHADLVVFDLDALEANPRHNLAANVLYSINARSARDVFVDGERVVSAGSLTRIDRDELRSELKRRWSVWRA